MSSIGQVLVAGTRGRVDGNLSGAPTALLNARHSFDEVARSLSSKVTTEKLQNDSVFQQVQAVQSNIAAGKLVPYQELLLYQVRMGQLGLRVELLSKVAESVSSTVRKLQSGQ